VWAFRRERDAKREQAKSERSLLMIGDAHESASKLIADVLVDLRAKLEPDGKDGPLADARRIVNEHLDENDLPGNDDDSMHMRSVVLNSRGYLARSIGDFTAAREFYLQALGIRQKLLEHDQEKAIYQHNLAFSYDNLGDLHAAMAQALRKEGKEPKEELDNALAEYRKGLDLARRLAARPDTTPQWRHDLAVSYFKVGDAMFEVGNPEDALAQLLIGLPIAEQVAAGDPSYAKWQAHLGLYCLELGRLQALLAKPDAARSYLQRGKNIFTQLREQGHKSQKYLEWQKRIDDFLLDLE